MKAAACWSITAARLARLASAAINSRSTATVESRSSHKAIGRSVRLARLRAKDLVDCARSLRSVHIKRQAKHKTDAATFFGELQDPVRIGSEDFARNGLNAGCKPPVRVRCRDADCLGPEIEPDQTAARRNMRRQVFQ